MKKILIIEDDKEISMLERDYLEISGFEVDIISDGSKATADYLRDMLAEAREPHQLLGVPKTPTGASNLRIHRVFVRGCREGIVVNGR